MFTVDNTPRYGDKVMHGNNVVTVQSFMGVMADAIYGTSDAWASVRREDGSVYMCSLYELGPCSVT
jgi:hypothetical protein